MNRFLLLGSLALLTACSASDGGPGGTSTGGSGAATSGGSGPGGTSANGGSGNGTASGGSGNSATGGAGNAATGGTGNTGNTGAWHGAIATGATDTVLNNAYTSWRTLVRDCSDGSSVVVKDGGQVVSEGIGYGMLIAVGMGDQTLFDRLWKHYNDHLDPNGLMNWSLGVCDAAGNNNANAATDGDLDAAMALVQADTRWPGGSYLTQAETLAGKILAHEVDANCGGHATLRPGDKFGGCSDNGQINPGYYAPGYFRSFAAHFSSQAAQWNALLDASYWLYPILQARMAGLIPDWSKVDGTDWYGAAYWYDACRGPWRVATDYAWSGDDRAKTFLQCISGWVDANGGLPTAAQQQNSAFLGSFALSGIYDQTKLDGYVTKWLGARVDDTPYFQSSLKVIYLLVAAGKFPSGM